MKIVSFRTFCTNKNIYRKKVLIATMNDQKNNKKLLNFFEKQLSSELMPKMCIFVHMTVFQLHMMADFSQKVV